MKRTFKNKVIVTLALPGQMAPACGCWCPLLDQHCPCTGLTDFIQSIKGDFPASSSTQVKTSPTFLSPADWDYATLASANGHKLLSTATDAAAILAGLLKASDAKFRSDRVHVSSLSLPSSSSSQNALRSGPGADGVGTPPDL